MSKVRKPAARALGAALLGAIALSSIPAGATGTYLDAGRQWRDGKFVWYYSPSYTPAGMSEEYVVGAIKEALQKWALGCRIQPEYGGITQVPADPNNYVGTHQVTIGFFPSPQDRAAGRGGLYDEDGSGFANAGVVALNTRSPLMDPTGDGNWLVPGIPFKQILTHEIGHLLGVGHTQYPYSLMFILAGGAPSNWKTEPFGADYSTCADLYGSNGVVPRPYYGGPFHPDASFGVSVAMELSTPGVKPAVSPPDHFDLSQVTQLYKVIRATPGLKGVPQWRLVMPNGDLVDPVHYSLEPNNQAMLRDYGLYWMSSTLPLEPEGSSPFLPSLDGRWRLQAFVNGKPAAEQVFYTENGRIPAEDKVIEMALLVESSGTGFATRTVDYGQARTSKAMLYLNRDYNRQVQRFEPQGQSAMLELWARSDQPRVPLCMPSDTPDIVRFVHLLTDNGHIASNRIDVSASGNLSALSARAEIETAAGGEQSVFVVREDGEHRLLYRQRDGSWTERETALFEFSAPGAASFDLVRNVNAYDMPAGSRLHVAYGATFAEAVARGQSAVLDLDTTSDGGEAAPGQANAGESAPVPQPVPPGAGVSDPQPPAGGTSTPVPPSADPGQTQENGETSGQGAPAKKPKRKSGYDEE